MSGFEGESSMVKSKSIWEQVSITDNGEFFIEKSYIEKKKTNKQQQQKKNTIPEEIVFYILVRVPVELLHKKFRYVCKQWNSIISSPFLIEQSMLHSKPIRIIRQYWYPYNTRRFDIEDDELGWSCHPYPWNPPWEETPQKHRCSCNGLLLVSLLRREQEPQLRVINPITKQEVILPRCPSGCTHQSRSCGCGIAFANSTGEYKVVHVFNDFYGCEIFTLGCPENTWRRVHGHLNNPYERPFRDNFGWFDPILVNQSMLHWDSETHTHIYSMDINNEKLRKTNLPIHDHKDGGRFVTEEIIEMNGFLALCYRSKTIIDVWILKDFEKQIWIKQHSIVPEKITYTNPVGRMPRLDNLLPVAADGTVLFFVFYIKKQCGSNSGLFRYEMESRTLTKFKMRVKNKHIFIPHLNTLTRFKALVKSDAKRECHGQEKEPVEYKEAMMRFF